MSALLRDTRKKVDATLRTIEAIRELDFPYEDSKEALTVVDDVFKDLKVDLEKVSDQSDAKAIRALCQRTLEAINDYLPILGFIDRSTDVEGAPELHGPLGRLTRKAIGKNAKLIISSEWDFSPFTLLHEELTQVSFVLVGMPFTEANNGLAAPLSGHELGHNVWNREKLEDYFGIRVTDEMPRVIEQNWLRVHDLLGLTAKEQITDLVGSAAWNQPWRWAVAQSEELFCDFLGLLIFRKSYLYSMQYLLAPGFSYERPERYPSMKARVEALEKCARDEGIELPDKFSENFDQNKNARNAVLLSLSDEVVARLTPELFAKAKEIATTKDLIKDDPDEVKRHAAAFRGVVPPMHATSLSNLINAAWEVSLDQDDYLAKEYAIAQKDKTLRDIVLNEVLLKSIEVFEIEHHQTKS